MLSLPSLFLIPRLCQFFHWFTTSGFLCYFLLDWVKQKTITNSLLLHTLNLLSPYLNLLQITFPNAQLRLGHLLCKFSHASALSILKSKVLCIAFNTTSYISNSIDPSPYSLSSHQILFCIWGIKLSLFQDTLHIISITFNAIPPLSVQIFFPEAQNTWCVNSAPLRNKFQMWLYMQIFFWKCLKLKTR